MSISTRNLPLGPMDPEAIKEIKAIIEGIRSGKLEHNQSSYHCGTAHCIAGWWAMNRWAEYHELKLNEITDKTADELGLDNTYGGEIPKNFWGPGRIRGEWNGAAYAWKLTPTEANAFFMAGATLKDMEDSIVYLEQGHRLIAVQLQRGHYAAEVKWVNPALLRRPLTYHIFLYKAYTRRTVGPAIVEECV